MVYGCHAGMQQEAYESVYLQRILRRGTGPRDYYSIYRLGAFGADLSAVACFFDPPWQRISSNLTLPAQAWLFNQAAFHLRALGRLIEAREPMRVALDMCVDQRAWRNASIVASNLSWLELTLGEVAAAIRDSQHAVAHADRSGDAFYRMDIRTTHAEALHQAGRREEAKARYAEAETMQAEREPDCPLLHSAQGFRYCDLLLADVERVVWQQLFLGSTPAWHTELEPTRAPTRATGSLWSALDEGSVAPNSLWDICHSVSNRAAKSMEITVRNGWLLDIGHDHLTLARAELYLAILQGEPSTGEHANLALDFLRRAGRQDGLSRSLLTHALWRAASGNFESSRDDLDEAFDIAERGPMRLDLADIHLHRARLFGLVASRPKEYPSEWVSPRDDLDKAHNLIDACGYRRRREELADAEAAWERLYATSAPHAAT